MKSPRRAFNLIFSLILSLLLTEGCGLSSLGSKKKPATTIRLYVEGQHADQNTAGTVFVTRQRFPYTVEREPILDEGDLEKASIVNEPGGEGSYSIQLKFKEHGSFVLDMATANNLGRHIIVFSQFPKAKKKSGDSEDKTKKPGDDDAELVEPDSQPAPTGTNATVRESGWLAAVQIHNRISSGIFRFTPDATRAEGFRIVRGLRNVIEAQKKKDF